MGITYGKGILVAHRSSISHLPQKSSQHLDISYTKYSNYAPNFGIGLNYINSGNQTYIGNIGGIYGFTKMLLTPKDSTLKFKLGIGTAYVEKIYDPIKNNKNIAIGTHWNANVVLQIEKEIAIKKQHFLHLGFSITHFSNGAFKNPNLGLNFVSFALGYSYFKNKKTVFVPKENDKQMKWSINIAWKTGFRENYEYQERKYPFHSLSIFANNQKNNKKNYLFGIDFFYNPSVQFFNSATSPLQIGSFIGKEWSLNKLLLEIDLGTYLFDQYKSDGFIYQRLAINYNITKNIKTSISLKLHRLSVAQVLQLGIAYQIKK